MELKIENLIQKTDMMREKIDVTIISRSGREFTSILGNLHLVFSKIFILHVLDDRFQFILPFQQL